MRYMTGISRGRMVAWAVLALALVSVMSAGAKVSLGFCGAPGNVTSGPTNVKLH